MDTPTLVPADTAWMLVATALVLLMTPALGFFYGGLVRSKNALNTMMMSVAALGFVGVGLGAPRLLARLRRGQRRGSATSRRRSCAASGLEPQGTIPHLLFMAFQGTFAIITAALISGAIVERMRFGPVPRLPHALGRSSSTRRSRTGCGAAAGSRSWARSTSPAAPSSTSTRRPRRSSPRSCSARARTTRGRRSCRTTCPSRCSARGSSGSAGSASTRGSALAANGIAALAFVNTMLAPIGDARRLDAARPLAHRQGDRGRRRDRHRGRPRRDHAGRRLRQPDVRAPARRDRRVPELLRAPLARAHAPRRLARRRGGARRRRHGRARS